MQEHFSRNMREVLCLQRRTVIGCSLPRSDGRFILYKIEMVFKDIISSNTFTCSILRLYKEGGLILMSPVRFVVLYLAPCIVPRTAMLNENKGSKFFLEMIR